MSRRVPKGTVGKEVWQRVWEEGGRWGGQRLWKITLMPLSSFLRSFLMIRYKEFDWGGDARDSHPCHGLSLLSKVAWCTGWLLWKKCLFFSSTGHPALGGRGHCPVSHRRWWHWVAPTVWGRTGAGPLSDREPMELYAWGRSLGKILLLFMPQFSHL